MVEHVDPEEQLVEQLESFQHDPLGFAEYAFPWGEKGTELEGRHLRTWQREFLDRVGRRLREGFDAGEAIAEAQAATREPVQEAVSSGHGIGKSALVSILILWALSTREDTRGVVTANTGDQLRVKTWPELAKWHRLAINAHWFTMTATALYATDREHEKTWRVDAVTWSETNTEAFAGLHNEGKRLLLIFDEASAISDKVWEVAEGALTDADTEIIWGVFGNPTRNSGRFHDCFGRFKHRWGHRQIDSRTVEGTNKAQLDKMIEDNGEDSDHVRIRVRGIFPRSSTAQLIGSDIIAAAAAREAHVHMADPVIVGVDVARFGSDESVIRTRQGLDARSIEPIKLRGVDTMQLAARVASHVDRLRVRGIEVDAIFVDETGIGAGVVDRLRNLGYQVIGVNNSNKPDGRVGTDLVANKGAEMWVKMRDALKEGLAIADDVELRRELESREYSYNARMEIVLESKDDMRSRGLSSPDNADALSLTFAYPVAPKRIDGGSAEGYGHDVGKVVTKSSPFRR
jgi:hypothetical protein